MLNSNYLHFFSRFFKLIFCLIAIPAYSQTWTNVGTSPNDGVKGGVIYAMTVFNGNLIAAGSFTSCNGNTATACKHIAQWNGTTWSTCGLAGSDGVNGTIYALTTNSAGTILVAGGSFTKCNNTTTSCNNIAQWNGANTATSWSVCGGAGGKDGVTGTVYSLAIYTTSTTSNALIAAGGITKCNGGTNSCNNIAQWNWGATNTSWTVCGAANPGDGLDCPAGQYVWCLTVFDNLNYTGGPKNVLVACGAQSSCNGGNTSCNNICQWDGTTGATSWSTCGAPSPNDGINYPGTTVLCVATYKGNLIAAGNFNGAGVINKAPFSTTANYIAQWTGAPSNGSWSQLGGGIGVAAGVSVNSLMVTTDLFVGGIFTTAGGVTCNNVAYWNGTSYSYMGASAATAGVGAAGKDVNASAVYNGTLYAGGNLTTMNGLAGGACNAIAEFNGGVLPISLVNFRATYNNSEKDVHLYWETASETNNKLFTVERTIDGINYDEIATVPGAGNSSSFLYYSAIDHNPIPGTDYYRLKQTDFDGHFTYSDPVPVNVDGTSSVVVFPNPVQQDLMLNYTSTKAGSITISIIDISGKIISTNTQNTQLGINTMSIGVSSLAKGIYFVKVEDGSNPPAFSKFIKD